MRFNLPADLYPYPVFCHGTTLLATAYGTGTALTVYNANTTPENIAFTSSKVLDTDALDAHIGSDYGRVTQWWDQVGDTHTQSDLTGAPRIQNISIGDHRALIFEGGGRSDNTAPPADIHFLGSSNIEALALTSQEFCYMAVVQCTSAMPVNQSGAPGLDKHTLVEFNSGGAGCFKLVNDGVGDGVTGGRWTLGDGGAFSFLATDLSVETTPVVITIHSDATGVKVYQNEDIVASANLSAVDRTATQYYLGKLITSVAGATSGAFDGRVVAEMAWPAISNGDAAARRAMLYELFSIDFRRSHPQGKMLAFCGDSNMAGYKCLGRNGWEKQMQASMTDVRFYNFGVEGSGILLPGGAVLSYAHTLGQFPLAIGRPIGRAQGNCGYIIASVGNDFGNTPQPTAAAVYAGTLQLIALARALNANVKIFVCTSTVWLTSYQSLQASTNTLIRNGAAANNYTVIDFAADPVLTLIFDRHLTESEHGHAAAIAAPIIKTAFGWT